MGITFNPLCSLVLVAAESLHWFDFADAARCKQTGDERNQGKQECDDDERRWIVGSGSEKHARH